MTWRKDGPQGNESAKVRFDVVPYMHGRILDLGCGPEKVFPIAIGVDNKIDSRLFGIKVNPDVPVETCERMPLFASSSADTVFSSHLLEHIEDYRAALAEWWRLVKPGGHLVLYLPHRDHYPRIGQPGANPDHKHDFEPQNIIDAMGAIAEESGHGWLLRENETRTAGDEYSFLQVYQKRDVAHCGDETRVRLRPTRTLGVVRLGAYGDALWITPLLKHWKAEGWHITLYTQPQGEAMLSSDPNIDRMIVQPHGLFEFGDGRLTSMWQTAYWLHEEKKYQRFVNLIGAVEKRLLPHSSEHDFYLPDEQRRRVMGRNYLEALHEWAGVPFNRTTVRVRFMPTAEELAWAAEERAKMDGPLVLINPAGTSIPKWWPHAQELADRLAAERVYSLIVGDLRMTKFRAAGKFGRVVGMDWPIRKLLALAAMAEVVVGTESVLVNAVAFEEPLKIVILSHSSHENLTRDWIKTIAVMPEGLECYPCHRIHADMVHCTYDEKARSAACQSAATAELVLERILEYLRPADAPKDAWGRAAA